jgi:NitT/TauT family transport system substrate-binding protein
MITENRRITQIVSYILIFILFFVMSCEKEKANGKSDSISTNVNKFYGKKLNLVTFQTQWLHQAQFAGFYVAHKKGFYNNIGIDVRIEMGGPDNPSPEALQKNKADFVSMFLTSALREIDQGKQIVNVGQISQKSSLLLVAKKSSGIRQIKDINGKRVGLWVNDFREPSITFLNKNKIKADIVPISWTVNVLTNDVVDIMNMMVYNEYDVLINTGVNPDELTIFPLADYDVNIPEDGIYCQKEFYLKNQALCHDFAEATMDGWIYALNHEEETLAIVLSYLRQAHLPANIPHQRWMLKKIREAVLAKPEQFGKLSKKDYNFAVDMLKGNGVIKNSVAYVDFVGYAKSK